MEKLGVIGKVDKPTNWCAQGIGPDPDKTAAIEKMERPQNVAELRGFLGMINLQQKFIETCPRRLCLFAIFFQARTNGTGAMLKKNLSLA